MRAVVFERYGEPAEVREVADPEPAEHGVVVRVEATGLCRSDWHGWMGHDPDVTLPHVPGHELAGVVEAVGARVTGWHPGDRVTVPFVCACGSCPACAAGDQQVCERQTQPGFDRWGSFAEYVALDHADVNLVGVPDGMSYATAAALGCRFATAFRAVVQQGRVAAGEWVAVHGCGGVGLSAVMIAAAAGARVVAVDVSAGALDLARSFGAAECVDATGTADPAAAVRELTGGGAQLSLDALGSPATCAASVGGLRRRGRHVQVGLLPSADGSTPVPMARAIALELELLGSHGMAAHAYPAMLELVRAGVLRPDRLVTATIPLGAAPAALAAMGAAPGAAGAGAAGAAAAEAGGAGAGRAGVTVIEPWA
ncbi:zinc-dependent alcohol dehydrogenase family protein [Streptomyces sp. NPDC002514]|uniref:zinc-dependent alcohol dehydrogenase family protein n=1 Tax=Streptomyces sp. NPDC001270 TaxID=3364554 RepID=UPI0036CA6FBF